jgi:Mlc titration factor MtfA (ptsG expression regulator)
MALTIVPGLHLGLEEWLVPPELQQERPALYQALRGYYGQDPAAVSITS